MMSGAKWASRVSELQINVVMLSDLMGVCFQSESAGCGANTRSKPTALQHSGSRFTLLGLEGADPDCILMDMAPVTRNRLACADGSSISVRDRTRRMTAASGCDQTSARAARPSPHDYGDVGVTTADPVVVPNRIRLL
jgi:hypothetical protein